MLEVAKRKDAGGAQRGSTLCELCAPDFASSAFKSFLIAFSASLFKHAAHPGVARSDSACALLGTLQEYPPKMQAPVLVIQGEDNQDGPAPGGSRQKKDYHCEALILYARRLANLPMKKKKIQITALLRPHWKALTIA